MANGVESHDNQMPWFNVDEANSTPPPGPFEPFVDERVIARFLQVVEMARKGEIPAHPIGRTRKSWRFRVSETNAYFTSGSEKQTGAKMTPGSSCNPRKEMTWVKEPLVKNYVLKD